MNNNKALGLKVHGNLANSNIDTSGEKIIIEGVCIESLTSKNGIFNFEHKSDNFGHAIGKILEAKKIYSLQDCDNKHHKRFFELNKNKPYIYVMGMLFNEYGHLGAQEAAAILRFDQASELPSEQKTLFLSIEGARLITLPNGTVEKCIARRAAVTFSSCNKSCFLEILDDSQDEPIPQSESDKLKTLLQSVFKKSEEEYQEISKGELKSPATVKMIADRKEKGLASRDRYVKEIGGAKLAAANSPSTMHTATEKPVQKLNNKGTKTSAPVISGSDFKAKIEAARKNKTVASAPEPKAEEPKTNVVSIKSRFPMKKSNNMRSTLLKNAKSGISALAVENLDKEMHKAISDEIYSRFDKKEELIAVIESKYPELNKEEILFLAKSTTYLMEKKTENRLESLIKGVGQLEFTSLPKMKGKPSSDVKTIDSPTYSADVAAHVASNKDRTHSGEKNKANSPASYKSGITEPGDEGGSFRSQSDKGVTGKPTNYVHLGAGNEVVNHEAMHGTFANLSNKHGLNQQQMGSVHNHLLNMIHPHDIKTIQSHMVNNGYDINSPNHHEEILAHVHQAVGGTGKNESSLSLDKQRKKTGLTQKPNLGAQAPKTGLEGENRNFNKTRLRDSWNLIREHAGKMDEGKLHQIANSNVQPDYKNYKKSEDDTDDEPENLPKLLKPFKSKAQLGYLMSHKEKIGGEKGAEEWLEHTDVKSLPEKVKKK